MQTSLLLKTRSREIGKEPGEHMSSVEGVSGLFFICVKIGSITAYLYAERKAPGARATMAIHERGENCSQSLSR